jgi:hypothetical protein
MKIIFLDTNGAQPHDSAQQDSTTAEEKVHTSAEDATMDSKEAEGEAADVTAGAGEGSGDPATATPASNSKSKARRKSGGVPEHKSKKLNKKASKAKMSHVDAKPGDYYFIRLKGYPLWPGIVCSEDMLPEGIVKSRPVTAARPDGSYRADFEDGGKKVHDRTFPVMYLFTNEL